MDESLRAAFRATTYQVNLDLLRWATIRIDAPLPAELAALTASRSWAFTTAWNPQARQHPSAENLSAQTALLAALQVQPELSIYPAIGVGNSGWSEPSLFVIGVETGMMDALACRHGQLAYVHGHAGGVALLRELG